MLWPTQAAPVLERLSPVRQGEFHDVSAFTHAYGEHASGPIPALRKSAAGLPLRGMLSLLLFLWVAGCAGRAPMPVPQPLPETPPARIWSAAQLADLRAVAQAAPGHGFALESEAIAQIDRLEPLSLRDAEMARRLDATADAVFERLALSLAIGAFDPAEADPEWRIARPLPPDVAALRQSVVEGAAVTEALEGLLPVAPEYAALVTELARVQSEAEGARDADGISKEARVARLRASLERWRWLPRDLPTRRIDVLVPFFELRLRDAALSTSHAIIVGARGTQTPSFAAAIETITLNPTWTPPSSILLGELLPRLRRDPEAVAREGYDVMDSAGRVVDPAQVDWRARPFRYTLRQRAGPANALGRLRFDLPNPYAVFLHDTPSRGLFGRENRALSHGCIRVSEPVTLAADALADPLWDEAALNAAIDAGETQVITLGAPLPIYILYLTAAPDQEGVVQYAGDVYGRDAGLLRALDGPQRPMRRAAVQSETECAALHRGAKPKSATAWPGEWPSR